MSINISELEKKIIPQCNFVWRQKCINKAPEILALCAGDSNKILPFFNECENKIKNIDGACRIIPNIEIQNFDGDEYEYVWFIFSDILNVTVKLAIKVDVFNQIIGIGNMNLATKKEHKKL